MTYTVSLRLKGDEQNSRIYLTVTGFSQHETKLESEFAEHVETIARALANEHNRDELSGKQITLLNKIFEQDWMRKAIKSYRLRKVELKDETVRLEQEITVLRNKNHILSEKKKIIEAILDLDEDDEEIELIVPENILSDAQVEHLKRLGCEVSVMYHRPEQTNPVVIDWGSDAF